jgi:hypothetical protein
LPKKKELWIAASSHDESLAVIGLGTYRTFDVQPERAATLDAVLSIFVEPGRSYVLASPGHRADFFSESDDGMTDDRGCFGVEVEELESGYCVPRFFPAAHAAPVTVKFHFWIANAHFDVYGLSGRYVLLDRKRNSTLGNIP